MDWLSAGVCEPKKMFGYITVAALIGFSLDEVVRGALTNWGVIPVSIEDDPLVTRFNVFMLFELTILAPLIEETIFRVVPLWLVVSFVSQSPRVIFPVMVASSTIFGFIHPYALHGRIDTAVGGVVLGVIFLKCGGLQQKFVQASLAAMATHGLVNLFFLLHAVWQHLALQAIRS